MISMKPLFGYMAYHQITMKEFSEKTGINYITVTRMKKEAHFNTTILEKICSAYNLNIKDIMVYIPD